MKCSLCWLVVYSTVQCCLISFLHYSSITFCLVCQKHSSVCVCSQLRDAFVYQMTQGFSHFDRQLRNDLLVIISLVSAAAADVPYVQSGLAKHLALFATFQEGNFSLSKLFAINSVDC